MTIAASTAPQPRVAAPAIEGLPPGPSAPRAVQTAAWVSRPGPFLKRNHARYGDMFTVRLVNEDVWVMLSDPDAVKQVFTASPELVHAGEANVVLLPVLGHHSVLLLDDAEHMRHRKMLLPPFHGERMQEYGDLMREAADREIDRWPAGQPFPLAPGMQAVTLEVIMRAVFGITNSGRLERLGGALRRMLEWSANPTSLAILSAVGPRRAGSLGPFRRRLDPVDEILFEEIRARRGAADLAERADIMSLLLQARHEDGSAISDRELRDELMTLLVAGHETTATALSWAIERLVRHPDKLERLAAEVTAGQDEYLDAICKETLRLRPVLPIVLRRLTAPMEIGGRLLPAGVSVAPCVYLIHRRPDIYPEPERFMPERFLDRPAGTYTWIPFGGGVRRCLGASFALFEMKTVLARIVQRADLRPADPASERTGRRVIALIPHRGAEVVMRPRAAA
jgi:cytochrome P450